MTSHAILERPPERTGEERPPRARESAVPITRWTRPVPEPTRWTRFWAAFAMAFGVYLIGLAALVANLIFNPPTYM